MKTKILIVLMLFWMSSFAQTNQDINFDSINSTINLDTVQWTEFNPAQSDFNCIFEFNPITINMLLEYVKECALDTIKATKIQDQFIIDRISYREMISETQLNKEGYFYDFRWVISNDPFEYYYFIKKPTLKGFAEWLKLKRRL